MSMIRKFALALVLAASCGSAAVWAQEPAAAAPAAETPAAGAAPSAAADSTAAAPAEAAPADAAAAPVAVAETAPADPAAPAAAPVCGDKGFDCNKGDVSWMMTSTAFVLLMTLPGLALFYGGLVRTKNMLSTMMQSFTIFCVIAVLWVIYGYSVAFTTGTPFYGSLDKLFMKGDVAGSVAATFSKGQYIPDYVFCCFQLTFAAITVALISGGYAERFKFSAMLIFSVLWFTFSYLPIAHMVWYWDGPDSYLTQAAADLAGKDAGFLFSKGALDFAGGTVVHINSGIAALVCAIVLGKRTGLGKVHMAPHSLTMTMIGTGLLWFGWFGFNAGSALEAGTSAGLAFFNTLFATAVAALAWMFTEWMLKGKPSLLGICSGAVAGLVVITPAAGFVGVEGDLALGITAGVVCLLASTKVKQMLGYDDALDTFGVHCVGGIIGAIGTGIFVNPALGGVGVPDLVTGKETFDATAQLISQFWGVGVTLLWSGTVALVILLVLKYTIGIRSSDEAQEEGLDIADHGEKAYNY
jgi:Amt family ammonium transporter